MLEGNTIPPVKELGGIITSGGTKESIETGDAESNIKACRRFVPMIEEEIEEADDTMSASCCRRGDDSGELLRRDLFRGGVEFARGSVES